VGIPGYSWELIDIDGNSRYKWKYNDRDGKTKYRWEYKLEMGIQN